jgi:hypothetical protein
MDHEGVDVNLTLPSGWFGTWTAGDDVALEMRSTAPLAADGRLLQRLSKPARRRNPGGARGIDGALT